MSNLCGTNCGEALSRWCAMVVSNNALSDFATAPTWFADGMPNFVDTVDPTDQNADSTGCGMAFLSFVMGTSSHPLSSVARAMVSLGDGGTLADLYYYLGMGTKADAWPKFQAAVNAVQVVSDDPFNAMTPQPQPGPTGPTGPGPQPGPTGATGCTGATGPAPTPGVSAVQWACLAACSLIAGVAIGETPDELKADINAIPT